VANQWQWLGTWWPMEVGQPTWGPKTGGVDGVEQLW